MHPILRLAKGELEGDDEEDSPGKDSFCLYFGKFSVLLLAEGGRENRRILPEKGQNSGCRNMIVNLSVCKPILPKLRYFASGRAMLRFARFLRCFLVAATCRDELCDTPRTVWWRVAGADVALRFNLCEMKCKEILALAWGGVAFCVAHAQSVHSGVRR